MKIRKLLSAAAAVMLIHQSAYGITTDAAANGGFTQAEIENSEVKPVISLPEIQLTVEQAKASPTINVQLIIENGAKKYSTAEIWTSFDKRLSVSQKADGNPDAKTGNALQYMSSMTKAAKYIDNSTGELKDLNGVKVIASSGRDYGQDGTIFSVNVTLPDDVKAGDYFPLDIVYIDEEISNNKFVNSTFLNVKNDDAGKLMQAWTFTKGISNGYIKITSNNTKIPGDVNLDGNVTLSDSVAILQYLANKDKYPLVGDASANADVYSRGDGITAMDALTIQKYDAKIIEVLPESYLN